MYCTATSPFLHPFSCISPPLIRHGSRRATFPPGEGFFLQSFYIYANLIYISSIKVIPMSTLCIGFKGTHNPSSHLVTALPGDTLLLTNSIPGLTQDIAGINRGYDAVYLFGIDKTLNGTVRVETCAQVCGHTLTTALDPTPICATLAAQGLPAAISHIPTHYLCNEAYYQLLLKFQGNALLIHIPGLRHMTEETLNKLRLTFSPP